MCTNYNDSFWPNEPVINCNCVLKLPFQLQNFSRNAFLLICILLHWNFDIFESRSKSVNIMLNYSQLAVWTCKIRDCLILQLFKFWHWYNIIFILVPYYIWNFNTVLSDESRYYVYVAKFSQIKVNNYVDKILGSVTKDLADHELALIYKDPLFRHTTVHVQIFKVNDYHDSSKILWFDFMENCTSPHILC